MGGKWGEGEREREGTVLDLELFAKCEKCDGGKEGEWKKGGPPPPPPPRAAR